MNKLEDQDCNRIIKNYEICALIETHLSPLNEQDIRLDGYKIHHRYRKRNTGNSRRASGGLAICIKDNIHPGVKYIDNVCEDLQWIKLDKSFFSMNNDIYVCFVYANPVNSTYNPDCETMICLEDSINKLKQKGSIIIMGDLNGYTNCNADYCIESEKDINFIDLPENYTCDAYMKRNNMDTHNVNERGAKLLQLCISSNMCILNGRKLGDSSGKPTCYEKNANNPSTIDYGIISKNEYNLVTSFRVQDFTVHSDHCPIDIVIRVNSCNNSIQEQNHVNSPESLRKLPNKYLWEVDSTEKFKQALHTSEIKKLIHSFNNNNFGCEPVNVEKAVSDFNNIIIQAANVSLRCKKTYLGKKKKKVQSNSVNNWSKEQLELTKLCKQLARLTSKHPRDPSIRAQYYQSRKRLKKAIKQNEKTNRTLLINKLSSLESSNPREFWDVIAKLDCPQKKDNAELISPEKWVEYFEDLLNRPVTTGNPNALNEGCAEFNELDFHLTELELTTGIKKLKLNKSCGLDMIRNEMIKYGHSE